MKRMTWARVLVVACAFLFFMFYVLDLDSWARVGGGSSSGSRGSRSYSSPSRPSPGPSQSYSSPTRPTPAPSQTPAPQSGGFMRGLMGGLAGGFLGSMLFSSLGWGAGGGWGGGGGIGFIEILIFAAILFFLFRWMKRRRQQAYENSYYQESAAQPIGPSNQPSYQSSYGTGPAEADLDKGLRYIRQIDPQFDEQQFRDRCMDNFFKIQGAWQARDIAPVKNLLSQEMYGVISADTEKLRAERKTNKLENIAVRSVDITEAWQEQGVDYITVRFYANLLDYVVDDQTGQVVSGSKTDPVKFEEYWTFARNVGSNAWQLSAITQPN